MQGFTFQKPEISCTSLGDRLELDDEDWFCVVDMANVHPALVLNDAISDGSCYWA